MRLATLYEAVEEAKRMELQINVHALRRAEDAIALQAGMVSVARLASRAALLEGDRMECVLAETHAEIVSWNGDRLQEIHTERGAQRDIAEEQYRQSRMESEQIKQLRDGKVLEVAVEEGRRTQAIADDRFLARRRWKEIQARMSRS
jgi:hypothetical protein